MAFFFLLTIPLIVAVLGFVVLKTISWKEFLVQVGVQLVVAAASVGIIYSSNTWDSEILNGTVLSKAQVRVSCSHSYRCRCHSVESCSGSGKDRSCSSHEECDTCYQHANDWDWDVISSINTLSIDRVDSRGSDEPPRWTAVRLGEPVAVEHSYTNYVKAAPDTLFRHQGLQKKYIKFLPPYPGEVYDYYRLNRLVLVNGAKVSNPQEWNEALAELNGKLGAPRQSNMVVVLAKNLPDDYYYALEEAWVGGKKNDTILVIGVDGVMHPTWAVVMAWSINKLFEVKLRDDIMGETVLTKDNVIAALDRNVSAYYKRKPMADFEYLQASITPTTTQLMWSLICGLMVALGVGYAMHRHDLFDEERRKQW